MRANDIPVAASLLFTRSQVNRDMQNLISRIEKELGYPVFVKPANLGSSVGISKCKSHSDLLEGLLEAARFDRRILVERGLDAREIEVSVLGNDDPVASIPGEVRPAEEFYTFHAKYLGNESELIIPARLDDEMTAKIRDIAVKTYKAIDCAGLARVDFLLDRKTGELVVSEVNTLPGFTSISMYPKLWDASGLSYPQLVDRLIELALQRKADRDATERVYRGQ
jgi:D-alanine-D-alanine ligase